MGWVADRIGIRRTVIFGAVMIAAGLAVSAIGKIWALYVGHGLLLGLLGNGAMFPPLLVYVSRWFDAAARHRAGADLVRPVHRRHGVADRVRARRWPASAGRRRWSRFAVVVVVAVPPIAALFLHPAPAAAACRARRAAMRSRRRRCSGMPPNLVLGDAVRRRVLLLRADGDAAEPPRRVLQRCRHPGGAGRGDAVGDAGLRLLSAASSGAGSPTGSAGCRR